MENEMRFILTNVHFESNRYSELLVRKRMI